MVNYLLMIAADLENLTNLEPQGGCDDPNFSYLFKLKCGRCGEVSQKETCVTLSETVALPVGKGTTNLIQKVVSLSRPTVPSSNSTMEYIVKRVYRKTRNICFQLVADKKGKENENFQCKFCGRDGTITMIPGRGKPLTDEASQSGKHAPLMLFDCRGYEPVEYVFGSGWKAESIAGTKFSDIDLSGGEYAEYDEKGECPVMISNVRSTFDVAK